MLLAVSFPIFKDDLESAFNEFLSLMIKIVLMALLLFEDSEINLSFYF